MTRIVIEIDAGNQNQDGTVRVVVDNELLATFVAPSVPVGNRTFKGELFVAIVEMVTRVVKGALP